MKPSEYYNEHFRIKDPKTGEMIKPKPLSDFDAKLMDTAFEEGCAGIVIQKGGRGRSFFATFKKQ